MSRSPRSLQLLLLLLLPTALAGARFTPPDDETVVETLPATTTWNLVDQVKSWESKLARAPGDARVSSDAAEFFIARFQETQDESFLGRARSALKPWWTQPSAPASILYFRAYLQQHDHEFAQAEKDLVTFLEKEPDSLPARLMLASLLQTRGDYKEALGQCERMPALSLVAASCAEWQLSFLGQATKARTRLKQAVAKAVGKDFKEVSYAQTALADMSIRLGFFEQAEAILSKQSATDSAKSLTLLADLFLWQKRYDDALRLLEGGPRTDSVLLGLTIAARELKHSSFAGYRGALEESFERGRQRMAVRHLREEARFRLDVQDDPAEALRLARENWRAQREPQDTRLYLRAALAAKDRAAVSEVTDWVRSRQTEDVIFDAILRGNGGGKERRP